MQQRLLNSRAGLIVAALAVALIATLGVRSYLQRRAYMNEVRRIAVDQEKVGIMSQAEYIRWRDLNSDMIAEKNLSDKDFDWCLMTLNQTKPYSVANSNKNAMILGGILLPMVQNNDVAPERRERLYKVVAPLLRSKEQLDRLVALNLMGALKERRAVPNILPLLNDPQPGVRPIARKALDKMGYRADGKAS